MTDTMKEWFTNNKSRFVLGLSLDGRKETHDRNRCNSFDLIDLDFFLKNWPTQPVKMTISDKNLEHLADDVIFIHEKGFQLSGCNFAEGYIMPDFETKYEIIAEQYKKLIDYYLLHEEYDSPRLFQLPLMSCETRDNEKRKHCGTGGNMAVVDYDGQKYPCTYFSPVSMTNEQLAKLKDVDFHNDELFINSDCFDNCYFYPVCFGCYGDNFSLTGRLDTRSPQKCELNKLRIAATANYLGKKLSKKLEGATEIEGNDALTIKAIIKINSLINFN